MERRCFMKNVGTSALIAGLSGCGEKGRGNVYSENAKLAGMTLEDIRKHYLSDLFDGFLPYMESNVIDPQYGGFMDANGNKRTWTEGRGIWTYSFLYNNLAQEERFLDIARKSVEFILPHIPERDRLFPRNFTRAGKVISSDDQRVYGDLFVAEGLTQYSVASGERKYLQIAKDILYKCIDMYDKPDYDPVAARGYFRADAPDLPGARVGGHWMLLILITTQMLEIEHDQAIEEISSRSVDAILNHHYNPEYGLINEVINHDMSRPDNMYNQFVYAGHAMETLWMILHEAERRKDKGMFIGAAEMFKRHVDVARDRVYGGVFRSLIHVDNNEWTFDKTLWVQQEILVGALFLLEHTGYPWAKELFEHMFQYSMDKFTVENNGARFWCNNSDRKNMDKTGITIAVGNYHYPRYLMQNILSLERMIRRGGRVSSLLS